MHEIEITNDVLNQICKLADQKEIDYDFFDGSLQDNFIFYNNGTISIEGKSAKYLIVKERHLNEWSSDLVLIMTDSDEKVEFYRNIFEGIEV